MKNTFPEQLETERLIIRSVTPADAIALNQAIVDSLPQLKQWMMWAQKPPTLEQTEALCRSCYARYLLNEDMMALLIDKTTGNIVGSSGLHDADWENRYFEVGYWGRSAFSGKGYMTEGVGALALYALNELSANRVFLTVDDRNEQSYRLAERLGFQYEGTLRNYMKDALGKLRNTRIYSLVPKVSSDTH